VPPSIHSLSCLSICFVWLSVNLAGRPVLSYLCAVCCNSVYPASMSSLYSGPSIYGVRILCLSCIHHRGFPVQCLVPSTHRVAPYVWHLCAMCTPYVRTDKCIHVHMNGRICTASTVHIVYICVFRTHIRTYKGIHVDGLCLLLFFSFFSLFLRERERGARKMQSVDYLETPGSGWPIRVEQCQMSSKKPPWLLVSIPSRWNLAGTTGCNHSKIARYF
jgi:hypothetical protein